MNELPELPDQPRVVQGAVTDFRLQRVVLDQRVEVMMRELGIEPAREHQRAQNLGLEIDADPVELGFQKSVVEARVVGDEQAAVQSTGEVGRDILEPRGRHPHLVGDLVRR